ncbi:hypothetical protein GQ457_12G024820 [Hibiscus cannabinus]
MAAPSTASTGWLNNISSMAYRICFFIIILHIPLFRRLAYLDVTVNEKESAEKKLMKVRTNAVVDWMMH